MNISELLPDGHIILNLQGGTQEEIIRNLSMPLLDDHTIHNLDSFVSDVLARERQLTTQVTDNVAFPHAHADQVSRIGLVLGLTGADGLPFDPDSPNRCRLFFLIAVPSSAPELHLELLANLVDFVMSEKLDSMLAAESVQDIQTLLVNY